MKALMRALGMLIMMAVVGCGGSNSTQKIGLLYVVGQGANTIQALQLASDGQLSSLAIPTFATSARPVSMVLLPAQNFVYVANLTSNVVSGYSLNRTTGVLTPIGTALPPTPVGVNPIVVGTNSSGSLLFVLNQGSVSPAAPSTISVFGVDPTRGLLTEVAGSPFPAPANPQYMVVSPNASFLYVVSGSNPSTISILSFAASGALTAAGSFTGPAGSNIPAMTIDAKGQFFYAPDSANNNIISASIASGTGALTQVAGSPFAAGTQPVAVAVDSTGTFVYASNAGSSNVSAYVAVAGVLTQMTNSPYSTQAPNTVAATQPGFLTVDASNNFLYVSNVATRALAAFNVNPGDGSLIAVANSPFGQTVQPVWLLATR